MTGQRAVDHLRGRRIAQGRTAEVFAWDEDRVLKLFRMGYPGSAVEREADITRRVHAAGVHVPRVEGTVEVEGRAGIVYERIEGPSLLESVMSKPWTLTAAARLLANLHAAIHACSLPGLPSQRRRMERAIRAVETIPAETKEVVLNVLTQLPDGHILCHGDLHPGNVLLSSGGAIIIDWMDASEGDPLADVVRTSLLLRLGTLPPGPIGRWLVELGRTWFDRVYVARYSELRPVRREQIATWLRPVAAARLLESVSGKQERRLLALVKTLIP